MTVSIRTSQSLALNILVVDDSESARQYLRVILAECGISEIRLASCGLEALSQVCKSHPDCIFINLTMFGMDGFTASTVIRDYERSRGRRAIIVAISNYPDATIHQHCLDADIDYSLRRPVSVGDLPKIISQVLRMRSQ